MIAIVYLLIPLIAGLTLFKVRPDDAVRKIALFFSTLPLIFSVAVAFHWIPITSLEYQLNWIPSIGSTFHIQLDPLGVVLCTLTSLVYPLFIIGTWRNQYAKSHQLFALLFLTQVGLFGVFLAMDALLFYFFWELAVIPIYFLSSLWGGEQGPRVTLRFLLYTISGSLVMFIAILYVYLIANQQSFDWHVLSHVNLPLGSQQVLFWMLFAAFAIKVPIFPVHTWSPDLYEHSATPITIVLNGVMGKMGILGIIRWLIPIVPLAITSLHTIISVLLIVGMIYMSLLAWKQDHLKRFMAYSSIAHISLVALALFSATSTGWSGALFQLFAHGIVVTGWWLSVDHIERKLGTQKISELGGIAKNSPSFTIIFIILSFANMAVPFTANFVGEFTMFTGIFNSALPYSMWFTMASGLTIIFSSVYMLNMIRHVFFGEPNARTIETIVLHWSEYVVLLFIVLVVLLLGIYPSLLFDLVNAYADQIKSIPFNLTSGL